MKGHIAKRGRRGHEVYSIVYDEPRVADKPRKVIWERVGHSKREAQAKLAERLHEMNRGLYVSATQMTLAQYLTDHWLPRQKGTTANKTFETSCGIAKRLISEFGPMPLAKLQAPQISAAYDRWLKAGGRKGAPLSALTIRHIHRTLSHALKRAVKDRLIGVNVCEFVDLPRVVEREVVALDASQATRLIAALSGTRIGLAVKLAVFSGLRRGELLALTWDTVEFERSRILVRQSLEQVGQVIKPKEPKSKQIRSVSLDSEMMADLRRHRVSQRRERLALGLPSDDSDYVFPSPHHPENHPWTPHSLSDSFTWYASRLCPEIPKGLRFHGLRHTHVALLARAGIHPHVASKRAGHASISFTFDRYGHIFDQQDQEAATIFAAAMQKGASVSR